MPHACSARVQGAEHMTRAERNEDRQPRMQVRLHPTRLGVRVKVTVTIRISHYHSHGHSLNNSHRHSQCHRSSDIISLIFTVERTV